MIKSTIPEWNPQTFKSDFEKATMNAIKEVFPDVTLKGCFFHYTKAVWKKGRELGLTKSKVLKRQVELSAALPLLPETKIIEGWFYVASQSPNDGKSEQFRRYMLTQWVKENMLSVVSVFRERHRTTNSLEGWHHKLNQAIAIKKPTLLKLLHFLYEDALYFERNVCQRGQRARRSQKSIDKDQFVAETQLELTNGNINVALFLERNR